MYFKNFFRIVEILAWGCLPGSILFVAMFYWGLPESVLFFLGASSLWLALILFLFLNVVILKFIQAKDEGRSVSTWELYEQGISKFPSYSWILVLVFCRVLIWSLPFLWIVEMVSLGSGDSGLASFWTAALISTHIWFFLPVTTGVSGWVLPFFAAILTPERLAHLKWMILLWPAAFLFLLVVVFLVCVYSFAGCSFIVDGKRGMESLRHSKKLIRGRFRRFLGTMILLSVIMYPFYHLIFRGIGLIQEVPLKAGNLFLLIFLNCVVNLSSSAVAFFPMVIFYCLYKKYSSTLFD